MSDATTAQSPTTTGSEAPNGEGPLVEVDPARPWAAWPTPDTRPAHVKDLQVVVDESVPGGRLALADGHGVIGYASRGGLQELSRHSGFPIDFVEKLSLATQATVIGERLRASDDTELTFTREPFEIVDDGGGRRWSDTRLVTNVAPGWRGVVPHAWVAQRAFDVLAATFGAGNVEVNRATRADDATCVVRLMTPLDREVERPGGRRVGDLMRLGVEVTHRYGVLLAVRLFALRLVCTNGMTAATTEYEWTNRRAGASPAQQLEWVGVGIGLAVGAFDEVVERATRMAATPVEGDATRILLERARAMRLPARHDAALIGAFRTEPEMTEWGMLNAFTHLASHGEVTPATSRRVMEASGRWVEGFDVVTARLPRPIATAVGAHIIEEQDDDAS